MGLWWLFLKWVGLVKEPLVIFFAVRDSRVKAGRKVAAIISVIFVLLYIVNPLDLIPDFLPFGFIDDLAVIPLATYFIERMLPREVVRESRLKANMRLRPFTIILNIIAIVLLIFVLVIIASIVVAIVLLIQRFR